MIDAWRGPAPLTDARLAAYLGAIFEAGRAPATAALAVAAVRFRAKLAGQPAPAGEATARVLGGYRRTAAPLRADGLAAILATAARPPRKSCWPATGKPPAWSLTTRPARPPNAGPSHGICKGGDGGDATTAIRHQSSITQG